MGSAGPHPRSLESHGARTTSPEGIDSVTAPGAVAGWNTLHKKFGRLAWRDLFQSAIFYADHGFPVAEIIQHYSTDPFRLDRSLTIPKDSAFSCPTARSPALGQIFQNPDVAKALRLDRRQRRRRFLQRRNRTGHSRHRESVPGGTMAAADLAEFQPRSGSSPSPPPIADGPSTNFRPTDKAWPRSKCSTSWRPRPPRLTARSSVAELHKKIEAMKLAYADLHRYDADPRFAKVPVKGLLAKDYAQERGKLINPAKADAKLPTARLRATQTISRTSSPTTAPRSPRSPRCSSCGR